jgi:hypothetical protein
MHAAGGQLQVGRRSTLRAMRCAAGTLTTPQGCIRLDRAATAHQARVLPSAHTRRGLLQTGGGGGRRGGGQVSRALVERAVAHTVRRQVSERAAASSPPSRAAVSDPRCREAAAAGSPPPASSLGRVEKGRPERQEEGCGARRGGQGMGRASATGAAAAGGRAGSCRWRWAPQRT